jgi:hypothetical protein
VSLDGKIIHQETLDVNSYDLQVFNLDNILINSGVYVVKISNQSFQKTAKIMVK